MDSSWFLFTIKVSAVLHFSNFVITVPHSVKKPGRTYCMKQTNYLLFYLHNEAVYPYNKDQANVKQLFTAASGGHFKSKFTLNLSENQLLYKTFPIDPIQQNYVREVSQVLFSMVQPIPFRTDSVIVAASFDVISNILDLDSSVIQMKEFVEYVGGAKLPPGSVPMAHRYGGHQFGYWAGQLGDGRAVLLGDFVNRREERWELQLKGSGLTPYSRHGDGRAVLRSSVREFLCSEAMHHLGVPTSRAATLVVSNDRVFRDRFYDGNPKEERAAVVLRVARSWFRIGSLEILSVSKEYDLLKQLVDFVIDHHFPNINSNDVSKYLSFFSEVVSETASLMAQWQSVGFVHGVCNTDNFSLLSITIDYGPFGFMEAYDPQFVPNTSDDEKRYSFEKQPDVGLYNLNKLRIALLPLLKKAQKKETKNILKGYVNHYKTKFMEIHRKKLGLIGKDEDDEQLVALLYKMMQDTFSDFTMTFRQLGEVGLDALRNIAFDQDVWALQTICTHEWFPMWVKLYTKRLKSYNVTEAVRRKWMNSVNPVYVLRNWIAENATSIAEHNDFSGVQNVFKVLQNPYTRQTEADDGGFADPTPVWAKHLKVSCSS